MRRNMNYKRDHDLIVEICSTAVTLTEVELKLGRTTPNGSLRRYIRYNNIPMPNFLGVGVAALRGGRAASKPCSASDLCEDSLVATCVVKKFLLRNGLKTEVCESCGWDKRHPSDGRSITQIHHVNGVTNDNRLSNLQILCPNCHAMTPNFCGRNMVSRGRRQRAEHTAKLYSNLTEVQQPKPPKTSRACRTCGTPTSNPKYCSKLCINKEPRVSTKCPGVEALKRDIAAMTWRAIGKKYGVSDTAVKKWARKYGLLIPVRRRSPG